MKKKIFFAMMLLCLSGYGYAAAAAASSGQDVTDLASLSAGEVVQREMRRLNRANKEQAQTIAAFREQQVVWQKEKSGLVEELAKVRALLDVQVAKLRALADEKDREHAQTIDSFREQQAVWQAEKQRLIECSRFWRASGDEKSRKIAEQQRSLQQSAEQIQQLRKNLGNLQANYQGQQQRYTELAQNTARMQQAVDAASQDRERALGLQVALEIAEARLKQSEQTIAEFQHTHQVLTVQALGQTLSQTFLQSGAERVGLRAAQSSAAAAIAQARW